MIDYMNFFSGAGLGAYAKFREYITLFLNKLERGRKVGILGRNAYYRRFENLPKPPFDMGYVRAESSERGT
jgi:hypothetical protein